MKNESIIILWGIKIYVKHIEEQCNMIYNMSHVYYGCGTYDYFSSSQAILGRYSLSGMTSYRQIPWSLEAARLDAIMIVALKFVRHLGNAADEVPIKFQSDWKSLNPDLAAARLDEILR